VCFRVCPQREIKFSEGFGEIKGIYLSYSRDEEIRLEGASGGVVTQLLLSLLKKGAIEKAVVPLPPQDKPWVFLPQEVSRPEDIVKAAGSKYLPIPQNRFLKELSGKKVAFVGLPCQVKGVRNLQKEFPEIKEKLNLVIGLFCGNNLSPEATESILKRLKVPLSEIKKINYKTGPYPGFFKVELKNSQNYTLSKFSFNYLIPFYILPSCLICGDYANELSDISVGETWFNSPGHSLLLVRTTQGEKMLKETQSLGKLSLAPISLKEAKRIHCHGLDFKKKGSRRRVFLLKKLGQKLPLSIQCPPVIPLQDILRELFFLSLFFIAQREFLKKLSARLPIKILEKAFFYLRSLWRAVSGIR
jgi:coenzyme F420 hydrogenase subunit beta